jgi:tetrahydromethanopterin S-methyltransferase subunit F
MNNPQFPTPPRKRVGIYERLGVASTGVSGKMFGIGIVVLVVLIVLLIVLSYL